MRSTPAAPKPITTSGRRGIEQSSANDRINGIGQAIHSADYGCLLLRIAAEQGNAGGAPRWMIFYGGTNDLRTIAAFWGMLGRHHINIQSSFGTQLDEIYGSHLRVTASPNDIGAIIEELQKFQTDAAIEPIPPSQPCRRYEFEALNIASRPGISERIGAIFAEIEACIVKEIQRTREVKRGDDPQEIGAIHLTLDIPEHAVPRIGNAIKRIKAIFKNDAVKPMITLEPSARITDRAARN